MPEEQTDRGRANNFGLLRLLFAALVLVSHAPELLDGNRSRELLTRLFGTLSFGEAAVDGFFLVSGYLITRSCVRTGSAPLYLAKRVLRIVPGYVVCFLLCVLILTPFAGRLDGAPPVRIEKLLVQMLLLVPPDVPGVFPGAHYPFLNGAMWTIAYEFRCYLIVLGLGLLGFLTPRRRRWIAAAALALLLANGLGLAGRLDALFHMRAASPSVQMIFGTLADDLRFAGVFAAGMVFWLYRDRIVLSHAGAAAAALALAAAMTSKLSAEAGYATAGGYLIFWFAHRVPVLWLSRLDNRADISYGLYLYGWPVQAMLVWYVPGLGPWGICGLSLILATVLGYLSWTWVERPALALVRHE